MSAHIHIIMNFRRTTSSLVQAVTHYNRTSSTASIVRPQIRYKSSISSRYKTNNNKPHKNVKVTPSTNNIVASTPLQKLNSFMLKPRPVIGSLSALSNNVAFGCGAICFMCSDICQLRYMAITSQTFMITSNYFISPKPLWSKLRWNVLLWGINVVMLTNLLIERHKANNLPEACQTLYRSGEFEKRGFDKVNFMKFFEAGQKMVVVNDTVTEENEVVDKLCFVLSGEVEVGDGIATIKQGFIGELSFLMYAMDYVENGKEQPPKIVASARTTAKGRVDMYVWDSQKLAAIFKKDRALSNAFAAYCNHDLRLKLLGANEKYSKPVKSDKYWGWY